MLIVVSCVLFFSCNNTGRSQDNGPDSSESTKGSGGAGENNARFYILTPDGTPCSIVYPSGADENLLITVKRLKNLLADLCGREVELKSSALPGGEEGEIIVGDCGREAGDEFIALLRQKDWGYKITDKAVFVAGLTEANTLRALNYLIDHIGIDCEKGEDGSIILSGHFDYLRRATYQVNELKLDGVSINEYNVIYDYYAADAAREFCERVMQLTGFVLTPRPDTEPESAHEILFGDTGRVVSSGYYADGSRIGYADYTVELREGKLIFAAGTILALNEACRAFLDQYLPGDVSGELLSLEPGKLAENTADLSRYGIIAKDAASDIRVMTSNVYFYNFSVTRVNIMFETFVLASPDVLCLQEMSKEWHEKLDPRLAAASYEPVPFKPEPGLGGITFIYNYTPIYYLPKLYSVVDSGYKQFETVKERPDGDKSNSKSYQWAVFERRSDGKRFAVVSTHLTWYSDPKKADVYREQDAGEIVALVAKIETEYGVPVSVLGDMNAGVGSNPYSRLTSESLESVRRLSPRSDTLSANTYHDLGEMPLQNNQIIDHILVTKANIKADYYATLYNDYVIYGSDHCPLIADLTFTK